MKILVEIGEVVSVDYSTGGFIPGVPYKYIYRDIEEEEKVIRKVEGNVPRIEEEEKPPVIVFDVLYNRDNEGIGFRKDDINNLPNEFNIGNKWYGSWNKWTDNVNVFLREYTDHINDVTDRKLDERGVRDPNIRRRIKTIIQNALPKGQDAVNFYEDFKKSTFDGNVSLNSTDNLATFYRTQPNFGLRPKKVTYKGKEVMVDPMNDYYIQVVKITPGRNIPKQQSNVHLSGNHAVVGRYENRKTVDVLLPEDYSPTNRYDPVNYYGNTSTINTIQNLVRWDNSKRIRRDSDVDENLLKYGRIVTTQQGIKRFEDKGAIYVVEGICINRREIENDKNPSVRPEEDYYQWGSKTRFARSIVKAISRFVDMAVSCLPGVITTSSIALEIFNNPHNFLFEVILEKFSDNFQAFSPSVLGKFSQLRSKRTKEDRKRFLEGDEELKKYVSLDRKGNMRYIFDGVAVMALFGFGFGIGLHEMSPQLFLQKNGLKSAGCKEVPPDRNTNRTGDYTDNAQNTGTRTNIPQNTRFIGGQYEIVNIEYSTGNFQDGINYTYYYITVDNEQLITQGDLLVDKANQISQNDPAESIRLKLDALEKYEMAQQKDPKNLFIQNKISDLKKDPVIQNNIMIQFLMNMITVPIKAAMCIIEYILDFFTNLRVLSLPADVLEFLKFEWIKDFVKPTSILESSGLEFAPDLMFQWLGIADSLPRMFKLDVSQVLYAPFLGKLPNYSPSQLQILNQGGNKVLLVMGGIFKLFQAFLNAIMCFILNMFNVDKVFPCPEINLSKFLKEGLTREEYDRILAEQDYNFENPGNTIDQTAFVYDIRLDDGTVIKELNVNELNAFLAANSNLKYKFTYNE